MLRQDCPSVSAETTLEAREAPLIEKVWGESVLRRVVLTCSSGSGRSGPFPEQALVRDWLKFSGVCSGFEALM